MTATVPNAPRQDRDPATVLERFQLLGAVPEVDGATDRVGAAAAGTAAPLRRQYWWRREGIYLSDVCLAVCVSPVQGHLNARDGEDIEARDALYAYLRRVAQTALEHDFMRPLTCVLALGQAGADPATVALIRTWTAAQDWHRGAFTLYVEPAGPGSDNAEDPCPPGPDWDHRHRLADLLDPESKTLRLPPLERKSAKQALDALGEDIDRRPPRAPAVAARVRDVQARLEETVEHLKQQGAASTDKSSSGRDKPSSQLARWVNGVAEDAKAHAKVASP